MRLLKNLIEMIAGRKLFIDRDKCKTCLYLKSVSNWSPCYSCRCNDNYERSDDYEP